MASDPHNPNQLFNRLMDTADARGLKVGLRVGHLDRRKGARELTAIEVTVPSARGGRSLITTEPITTGGLQVAAGRLLIALAV